ncbi:phage portal protein [Corynebacterium liangguodongii]|nr:phage portal protein [Corynebacterium liangguodongii]
MVAEAALWWEGNTAQLASTYHTQYRPSQFTGGVVGGVSRWFWGTPDTQQRRRVHLPLAADIAATSATLLFDRAPTFTHPNQDIKTSLDTLVNPNTFPSELLVAGESCAALGGVGWRIMWDTTMSDHPWIDWVDADMVFPTFRYGRLESVMFCEQLPAIPMDKHVYRLFTEHEHGRITYRLMAGHANNVGRVVSLGDHPATIPLISLVDADSAQETGLNALTAGYIPNARPVVGLRRDGQLRNIGRPDLTPDLFPLFDALDEVWTEIRAELRLSRKKIIVPDWMLETRGFGAGTAFNDDREVFSPVRGRPDSSQGIEVYAPDLRVDDMLTAASAWAEKIIQRANYSPASFGMDTASMGAGTPTAREIEARYDASLRTWSAKSAYWLTGLQEAVNVLVQRDRFMHGQATIIEPISVHMERPVQETLADKAQTIQALDAARAISTGEKVAMLRPEWDDQRQADEVERIMQEQGVVTDPFGTAPDQPVDL